MAEVKNEKTKKVVEPEAKKKKVKEDEVTKKEKKVTKKPEAAP